MIRTDIGHGRGWLDATAAASLRRIDRQLGRLADINEAGRSPEQADANYRAWIAYSTGKGPKAAYALPASKSVHCIGLAADSDDWYNPAAAAVWRDNGWVQTALYPNDSKRNEPWHGEYRIDRDNHRHDPDPAHQSKEDEDMSMQTIRHPNGTIYFVDELGADHLGDYKTSDIALGEFLDANAEVFGGAEDVTPRQFDIAVAIATRRWDRKKAEIVAAVVKALESRTK